MSYTLLKPYTKEQEIDFIMTYAQDCTGTLRRSLKIEKTDTAIYALEANEIMQNGVPVVDPEYADKELAKAKKAKLAEISTAKEAAFKAGINFNGTLYDCDDRAQDRTGNRLTLLSAAPVETLEWLDYDYTPHTFTAKEFAQLCSVIFERVQYIEFKTGELLAAVNSAETLKELNEIEIGYQDNE